MSRSTRRRDTDLDVARGLPETTAEDSKALREAAATGLGRDRVFRLQKLLDKTISREQLAKRRNSLGEPFSL